MEKLVCEYKDPLSVTLLNINFITFNYNGCKALRTHADKRYISVIIIIIIINYLHNLFNISLGISVQTLSMNPSSFT